MLHFDSSQSIVKRDRHVALAPPYNTLPAFLNLDGKWLWLKIKSLRIGNPYQSYFCMEYL